MRMKLMALLAALALISPAAMAQTSGDESDQGNEADAGGTEQQGGGGTDASIGDTGMGGPTTGATPLGGSLTNMDNEDLVGKMLVTEDGTQVGEVEDVITDPGGNQRLVVSTSGMLGGDARMVTIDASEAQFDTSGENIMVGMSQEELMELPEYSTTDTETQTESQ